MPDCLDAAWPENAPDEGAFRALVREEGARLYRDLPWRGIGDAYAVLVSEVMLQQTQVKRVCGRWERFLAKFPTPDALAAASVSDVVGEWQGLGYNRRALALKRAAEICSADFKGKLPRTAPELQALPGIGPATAAGVVAFAYDEPAVYLETNVRTVFLHELFPDREGVKDAEIIPFVKATCPQEDVRGWYYALLDLGAHLKATLANPSRRSAHHTRQSAFEGSRRQKRAEVVRIVLAAEEGIEPAQAKRQLDAFERARGRDGVDGDAFASIVADLCSEGFFSLDGGLLRA